MCVPLIFFIVNGVIIAHLILYPGYDLTSSSRKSFLMIFFLLLQWQLDPRAVASSGALSIDCKGLWIRFKKEKNRNGPLEYWLRLISSLLHNQQNKPSRAFVCFLFHNYNSIAIVKFLSQWRTMHGWKCAGGHTADLTWAHLRWKRDGTVFLEETELRTTGKHSQLDILHRIRAMYS